MLSERVSAVKDGQSQPLDLVQEALSQIEATKDLNIFTEVYSKEALAQAEALSRKIAQQKEVGRLAGLVFAAKDNFLYRDHKTTAAAPFLQNFIAPYTATTLQKVLDEDAILVGKTNLDAFAHGTSTENSYFKATKNPHDPKLTPGGSSGGSAAAVAAGICSFALGTDTGGSVRLPASFCGLTGFKPTYGLLSRYGLVAMASSTDCVAPLAETPADIAYLLPILAGRDQLDGTTLDAADCPTDNRLPSSLTLGVIEEFKDNLEPAVESGLQTLIQTAEEHGWRVKTISLPNIELALACYYVLVSAEISSNLSRYDGLRYGQKVPGADYIETIASSRSRGFMAENKRRIMLGTYVLSQGYYEAYYQKAQKLRSLLLKEFETAFASCDALISPTSPTTAFALGSKVDDPLKMYLADLMTVAPSLAGIPATSIPLPTETLPVGMQIMTRQKSDYWNLKIAERLWGWL